MAAARTVSEPLEAHDLTVCFYLSSRTAFMFAATHGSLSTFVVRCVPWFQSTMNKTYFYANVLIGPFIVFLFCIVLRFDLENQGDFRKMSR